MVRVSRRGLLRGAGAALVAAPFMNVLSPRKTARAQAAPGVAKRIIFWFTPNGTVHQHWRPTGSGSNYAFAAGSILEPLDAHRRDLIVLDELNFTSMRSGNHEGGMEHMLTGGGDISLDQYLATQIGGASPFPSIELSVQSSAWGANIQTRMAYDAAHNYVHPEDNPGAAYQRLFSGISSTSTPSGTPSDTVDPKQASRRSVIDLVRGELQGLQRALGNEERVKLDAHLDALRRMEQRIGAVSSGGGSVACGTVANPSINDAANNDNFPSVGAAQTDLLVAAAACDLSRVLSLQWSHTVSPMITSWTGANEAHHELSHKDDGNAAGVAAFVEAERWFAGQFSNLLDKLAATQEPDGSGSLLDTSVVVWAKELADSRQHDHVGVPFVIAGSGNGYFQTGRCLKLGGASHQQLLVSLCQSLGLTNNTFGAGSVQGPLAGLRS